MKKKIAMMLVLCLVMAVAASATEYKTETDILYLDKDTPGFDEYAESQCRLDIYYPVDTKEFTTVVWFHGGGLRAGNKDIPGAFKDKGIAVVAVEYRFFPKVSCPVYIEDAAAGVAWVFKNIEKYGGSPDSIVISGHSAGGYLTSMVGLDKSYLAKHDIDANKIAALIPYSGHTITHFTVREERGISGKQPIVDKFAPLYHVRADAPPLILITGDREQEMLGRYEENAYMMRMMRVAGHKQTEIYEIGGHNHGEMVAPAHTILLKYLHAVVVGW